MLRRLLILIFIVGATNAIAQHKNSASPKTTEKQSDPEIDYKQPGAPMPPLVFIPYYDSSVRERNRRQFMTGKDIDNGANLLIMMFNPTCGHCQATAIEMGKNKELFKKSKVLMLATKIMMPYLGDFVEFTHATDYSFVHLGVDSTDFVNNTFLYQSLPQINIYNGERKLIRTYTGEVSIDTLKQYIQ